MKRVFIFAGTVICMMTFTASMLAMILLLGK